MENRSLIFLLHFEPVESLCYPTSFSQFLAMQCRYLLCQSNRLIAWKRLFSLYSWRQTKATVSLICQCVPLMWRSLCPRRWTFLALLWLCCLIFFNFFSAGHEINLVSDAPWFELPGTQMFAGRFLGVFGEGTNMSLLNEGERYLLPFCWHRNVDNRPAREYLQLSISEVSTGAIWARGRVRRVGGKLVPNEPQHLSSNLTGVYKCSSPGSLLARHQYQLEVVGKILVFLTHNRQ